MSAEARIAIIGCGNMGAALAVGLAGLKDTAVSLTGFDPDAARLHMGVEHEGAATDIEHGEIPVGLADRQPVGQRSGNLVGKIVPRIDDGAVEIEKDDHILFLVPFFRRRTGRRRSS